MTELPFTNGFYVSRHLPISHQRCINLYTSIPSKPTLSNAQLLFTPGIKELATTGTVQQRNRGFHVKSDIPYFVNGDSLCKLVRITTSVYGKTVETFTTENLGTVEGDSTVSMANNGSQLVILVPGGKGYIYNEDATPEFQEITDADFRANGDPQFVTFVDGYFLFTTDEKKFIVSSLNDGLTYNALDFASAESDPDAIVVPVILNNLVYILGTQTTEGFQNLPSVGRMPFIRNGVIIDKGCLAPFSVAKTNSTFLMVGAGVNESPAIWQFIGGHYKKVSTEVIDQLLNSYTNAQISSITALTYAENGAYFVAFNLPDTTLCYDVITEIWHERRSIIDEVEYSWRVASIVTAYSRILVGDRKSGLIGSLSVEYPTEYGNSITRLFTTQPFTNLGNEIVINNLELTMESGMGNQDVPNPVVSMSASSDGKTFRTERVRKAGRLGEYGKRINWYRNGRFERLVVLLFRLSEPIKSAFIKLEYE
jgi:hypothetical protein